VNTPSLPPKDPHFQFDLKKVLIGISGASGLAVFQAMSQWGAVGLLALAEIALVAAMATWVYAISQKVRELETDSKRPDAGGSRADQESQDNGPKGAKRCPPRSRDRGT
jgi:hypothetical protein